jgi:hypothetical protein
MYGINIHNKAVERNGLINEKNTHWCYEFQRTY